MQSVDCLGVLTRQVIRWPVPDAPSLTLTSGRVGSGHHDGEPKVRVDRASRGGVVTAEHDFI